jgi:hypothetical protein
LRELAGMAKFIQGHFRNGFLNPLFGPGAPLRGNLRL